MTQWDELIADEKNKPYLGDTLACIEQRRAGGITVYPPEAQIFKAFELTAFEQVKVVMLGQDPYHGPNQAHGLCFSVPEGTAVPPSLKNIYKELADDIAGFRVPEHGCLESWAKQGVLLLNSVLSVESGQANSHRHLGWEQFTDVVIDKLNTHRQGIVFLLWGSHAQKKGQFIDSNRHHVLRAPHPSPLAAYRGFFGCRHFSRSNQILVAQGSEGIDWQL